MSTFYCMGGQILDFLFEIRRIYLYNTFTVTYIDISATTVVIDDIYFTFIAMQFIQNMYLLLTVQCCVLPSFPAKCIIIIKGYKLGLSCAKLSLASAKIHTSAQTSLSQLPTNYVKLYLLSQLKLCRTSKLQQCGWDGGG